MKAIAKVTFVAALVLSSATAAYAQSEPSTTAASNSTSSGEVKKVDKSAGKVTIKHGPLKNIGMDAMTMVFRVKDPAMLDQIKAGDKINFVAEEPNGQLTVTHLQKQN